MARLADPAAAFLGAVAAATAARPAESALTPPAAPPGAERTALSVELPGRRLGRRIVIGRDVLAAWLRGEL